MHTAGRGAANASYYSAEQLRALRREAKVSPQETTPEGDAVSNVEDQASQTAEQLPRATYRLTRTELRFFRARAEKRGEVAAKPFDGMEGGDPEKPTASTPSESTSIEHEKPAGEARASPQAKPDAVEPEAEVLDDPAKRPLSAREIAKGRENRERKRSAELESPSPQEGQAPEETQPTSHRRKSTTKPRQEQAVHRTEVNRSSSRRGNSFSRTEKEHAHAATAESQLRIRRECTGIQHERPPQALPKTRETVRAHVDSSQRVIGRHTCPAIKTADAAARTEARQSAALAAKSQKKAVERAAEQAAKNAQKAAKHMADLARRNALRLAEQMKRASEAAIRASIAAGKALLNLMMAGGWVVVVIIIVLLMCVSILASPFGIFTHTDSTEFPDSISLDKAITTINAEYADKVSQLAGQHSGTHVVVQGNLEGGVEPANWVDVLAVFSVHLTMREDNAMDVVQLDETRLKELRQVFWDMNRLTIESDEDGEGNTAYYVVGTSLSSAEMVDKYRFSEQQKQLLAEITSDEYYAFWSNFVSKSMGYSATDWGGVSSVDPNYTPGMSGSVMKIPAIYQFDYKKVVCTIGGKGKSASTSGCGATSMCMVIHYLTGNTSPTPYTLFKWAYDNGYYRGDGLGHEAVSAIGKLYGVTGSWTGKNGEKIVAALKSGHPVIAHMGPGIFTNYGHYIVLKGVTDDGKILVNDPNSKSRTGKAYPLSTILKQSKTSTPFMICSKAN